MVQEKEKEIEFEYSEGKINYKKLSERICKSLT